VDRGGEKKKGIDSIKENIQLTHMIGSSLFVHKNYTITLSLAED